MNNILTLFLQQNSSATDALLGLLFVLLIGGFYFVPLFFVIWDIQKRHGHNNRLFWGLATLAILFQPIFLIVYYSYRNNNSDRQTEEFEAHLLLNHLVKCTKCTTISKKDSEYCGKCGTHIPKYCTHCQEQVLPNALFCTNCGTSQREKNLNIHGRHKLLNAIGYKIPYIIQQSPLTP